MWSIRTLALWAFEEQERDEKILRKAMAFVMELVQVEDCLCCGWIVVKRGDFGYGVIDNRR